MPSSSWREEYLAAIQEVEQETPVNRKVIDACSQLADRVAVLEAEKAALLTRQSTSPPARDPKPKDPAPEPSEPTSEAGVVAKLRLELVEAVSARGRLQTRLQTAEDELSRLRFKTSLDSKTLQESASERKILTRKLKDREEEIGSKKKLLADVQDELAVLNMQLDMVEKKLAEKEKDNKEITERFMRYVGKEADAMNRANEADLTKKRSK